MHLKEFLKKYDTVIFDMDGVITSESAYWDAAALTVYQEINATELFDDSVDVSYYTSHVKEIRKEVFCDDKLIGVLKNKGINSNWDLAYVTIAIAKLYGTKDFNLCMEYAEKLPDDAFLIYSEIASKLQEKLKIPDASRTSELWNKIMMRFQEWVLGDEIFEKLYGKAPSQGNKPGLLFNEEPVVDREKLIRVFDILKKDGKRLCTATGRIWEELKSPLEKFGIYEYFAPDGFINFNHVTRVQNNFSIQATKPHPYMFLKALFGEDYPDEKLLRGDYDKSFIKKALVVGDAGSDILGAKAMGADFCAVLTGIKGMGARSYFEELKAEYILDSILDFVE